MAPSPPDPPRLERVPPQDIPAEAAVLGAMLLEPGALDWACRHLSAELFYRGAHRTLYGCMRYLHEKGQAVDTITVLATLRQYRKLEEVGGQEYLNHLQSGCPSAANCERYGEIVREKALRRQTIAQLADSMREAEEDGDLAEVLPRAVERLNAVQRGSEVHEPITLAQSIEMSASWVQSAPVPSGLHDLDAISMSRLGRVTYLSGPPSSGKTALALQIVAYNAKGGVPGYIFSDDQVHQELSMRMQSAEAGICVEELWKRPEGAEAWARMASWPIRYHPDELRLEDVCATIRREAAAGTKIFLVDMVQGIRCGRQDLVNTRAEEAEIVSGHLKGLAKSLMVCILGIVEWNKDQGGKPTSSPRQSQIKGGGGLLHDADHIWIVWPDPDGQEGADGCVPTKICVTKNRGGRKDCEVPLLLSRPCNRFELPGRQGQLQGAA